jgi:ATP-binding cassette subfamily B (MDR/TAP) protein 1
MIFIASLCSAATGAITPVSIIFMAGVLTRIASAFQDMTDLVDSCLPLILITIYLATGTLVASYIANCFWILTGENQAQRMKKAYMHAIMTQDMAWFDKADEGSIVTRLSSDIQIIQDGISEKFGLFVMCISQLIAGFIVAFVRGWNLAGKKNNLLKSMI